MKSTYLLRNRLTLPLAGGILASAVLLAALPGLPALVALPRLLVSLPAALLIPGYFIQLAFFPRQDDLDGAERLALSFGLSVALIPQIMIVLDFLPWGIQTLPLLVAFSAASLAGALAAALRLARLPQDLRFRLNININFNTRQIVKREKTQRLLISLLGAALLLGAVSAAAILVSARQGEPFTEFYLLNPDNLADRFPRQARLGESLSFQVGLRSQENTAKTYRIEIKQAEQVLFAAGPLSLAPGEAIELPVAFTPLAAGKDVPIDFYLYQDSDPAPYRSLRLWLEITPPE